MKKGKIKEELFTTNKHLSKALIHFIIHNLKVAFGKKKFHPPSDSKSMNKMIISNNMMIPRKTSP